MRFAAIASLVLLSGCASTTPDFAFLKNDLRGPRETRSDIDMGLYPNLLNKGKIDITVPRSVSWAGIVQEVKPGKDEMGRTVVIMRHHFLAVISTDLQKKPPKYRFQLSKQSGGTFECRLATKEPVPEAAWAEFISKKSILSCTGDSENMNGGTAVIGAVRLESMPLHAIEDFQPDMTRDGRIALDQNGRPSYTKKPF